MFNLSDALPPLLRLPTVCCLGVKRRRMWIQLMLITRSWRPRLRCWSRAPKSSRWSRSMWRTRTPPRTPSTPWRSRRCSRLPEKGKQNGSSHSERCPTECCCGTARGWPTMLGFFHRVSGLPHRRWVHATYNIYVVHILFNLSLGPGHWLHVWKGNLLCRYGDFDWFWITSPAVLVLSFKPLILIRWASQPTTAQLAKGITLVSFSSVMLLWATCMSETRYLHHSLI